MKKLRRLCALILLVVFVCTSVQFTAFADDFENTHKNTGSQRIDIVSVARTQLGYMEGDNNDTKYGDWYGLPNQPWCAMFVSWCARQAGVPKDILRNCAIASPEPGYFDIPFYDGEEYTPKSGDIFFTKTFSHVGIVESVDGEYFYTLEGNTNDTGSSMGVGVFNLRRKISDYLFGVPDYNYVSKGHTCSPDIYYSQEAEHPHSLNYICATCAQVIPDPDSESYKADCLLCNTMEKPVLKAHTDSFLNADTVVFSWENVKNTTQYDFTLESKGEDGSWQVYEQAENVRSGFAWALGKGDYRAVVKACNSIFHTEENPEGMCMHSDYVYFSINKEVYSVTYDANGGENAPEEHIKQKGLPNVLSTSEPVREGYVFLGWSASSDEAAPDYKAGGVYKEDASVTLYAVWRDVNSKPVGLLGDSNGDSVVNIKDATEIQKHLAGIVTLTTDGLFFADADSNKTVNIKDATAIQKHLAGISTGYDIGEYIY